jgi:hypothetical protein
MRGTRLGCLTGTGIFATDHCFAIAGYAFASGGTMFSPGSRMLFKDDPGGASSHARSPVTVVLSCPGKQPPWTPLCGLSQSLQWAICSQNMAGCTGSILSRSAGIATLNIMDLRLCSPCWMGGNIRTSCRFA